MTDEFHCPYCGQRFADTDKCCEFCGGKLPGRVGHPYELYPWGQISSAMATIPYIPYMGTHTIWETGSSISYSVGGRL